MSFTDSNLVRSSYMIKRSVREALLNRRSSGLHHGFILMLILAACSFSAPATAEDLAPSQVQSADIPATFTLVGDLTPGEPGHLAVSWRGKEATELTIWIDFNNDDEWSDDEIVANNRPVEPGIEVIDFEVPEECLGRLTASIRYRAASGISSGEGDLKHEGKMELQGTGSASSSCHWESGWTVPDLDGSVSSFVTFNDGSGPALYVGGSFFAAGGVRAVNIAKWDGTNWSALGAGLGHETQSDSVQALEIFDDGSGPALYAGGTFYSSGSTDVKYLAKWNGTAWVSVGGGLGGYVQALKVWNGALFVGGRFSSAGSLSVGSIARWSGQSWSDVGGGVGSSGTVYALETFDDGTGEALYVGGNFSFFLSSRGLVKSIAKWNGTSWSTLGYGMNSIVYSLETFDPGSGTELVAGGMFTTAGGVAANRIAAWNGTAWAPLGTGMDSTVYSLMSVSSAGTDTLFAGGLFSTAGVSSAAEIAVWNGSTWQNLGSGCDGGGVNALGWFDDGGGGSLFAGGSFDHAGGNHAGHIAKWNGLAWETFFAGTDGDGLNDYVYTFAGWDEGSGATLYAGGAFTVAGAVEAAHVAQWTGSQWLPLGAGTDGNVYSLVVFDDGDGSALYAGGSFTQAGGTSASNIAKWDGSGWSALGHGLDGSVRALAVYDDGTGPALYAGGSFTKSGSSTQVNRVARWNGSSWSSVGGGLDNYVTAFATFDDGDGENLFAIGGFTDYIARWDGSSWSIPGGGVDKWAKALAVFDSGNGARLIVGGDFRNAGGAPFRYAAAWDGNAWGPLGSGPQTPPNSLGVFDDGTGPALYAGAGIANISEFDGAAWTSPLPRLDDAVMTLFSFESGGQVRLFAGGMFRTAGTVSSSHIASWSCTCSSSTDLTANEWQMIGLPCSPTGTTIGDIFGDDLAQADYDSRWVMYEWDRASEQYTKLGLSSALHQGPGYWIRTLDGGQTIDVDGRATATSCSESPAFSVIGCFSETLNGSSTGRWNMIGHPLSYAVNWGDVRFVDDSGNEWTPSEAETQGVASKNMYTWNGSAYQTWDDVTPGMLGTLGVFEGQWVKAFPTATALRIPAMPASGGTTAPARNFEEGEWMIRLTATSGDLSDPGNVFGQLAGSTTGLDTHDLPELAPFSTNYLTVVFPHPKWQTDAWAYTTDFHGIRSHLSPGTDKGRAQRWQFEIRSGTVGDKVRLSWQGPNKILKRSILVDLTSGRRIRPTPGHNLEIKMTTPTHRFTWIVLPIKAAE